jgi:hypothetical protein
MAIARRSIPPDLLMADPLARAKQLAEKMAQLLNDEDVSDVAIAVALLTSGVVHQYSDGADRMRELVDTIRKLEDQFLARATDTGDLTLQ